MRHTFARSSFLPSSLLVIDGQMGAGKTLLRSLCESFSLSNPYTHDEYFDSILIGYGQGLIDKDFASMILNLNLDVNLYNGLIGRNANTRLRDMSSIFRHHNLLCILKSMLSAQPNSCEAIARSKNIRHIIMSHMATFDSFAVEECLVDRAKIIYIIRDPLHILLHWIPYIQRVVNCDPTAHTPTVCVSGHTLPWFAQGAFDDFIRGNSTEQSIVCIRETLRMLREKVSSPSFASFSSSCFLVTFPSLTSKPEETLRAIARHTQVSINEHRLKRLMRFNRVPRSSPSRISGYWKDYAPVSTTPFNEQSLIDSIKSAVSSHYWNMFIDARDDYRSLSMQFNTTV